MFKVFPVGVSSTLKIREKLKVLAFQTITRASAKGQDWYQIGGKSEIQWLFASDLAIAGTPIRCRRA